MDGQQIYLPRLTLINKILVIVAVVIFIFRLITPAVEILGLSAENFFQGHVYNLVTYPFLSHSPIELILNALMIWLMGSEFESNWGVRRYLSFILTVTIGGGLTYLLVSFIFFKSSAIFSFPLSGLSGIVTSLCVAYAVIYPKRIFSFLMVIPIEAKYFCYILAAISLFQGLSGPVYVGAWGQLGGILFAYVFMVIVSHRNFKNLSMKFEQMTKMRSKSKSRANLRVVKNDDDNPKYWQ